MPLLFRFACTATVHVAAMLVTGSCDFASAQEIELRVAETDETRSSKAIQIEGEVVQIDGITEVELSLQPKSKIPAGDLALQFEVFCLGSASNVKLKANRQDGSTISTSLAKVSYSEAFITYSAPIYTELNQATEIRLQLRLKPKTSMQLKSLRLVPRSLINAKSPVTNKTAAPTEVIAEYLDKRFPGQITSITATENQIIVNGLLPPGSGRVSLVEIPMEILLSASNQFDFSVPVNAKPDGVFQLRVARFDSAGEDKALSRWRLVSNQSTVSEPISHCKYVEQVHCFRPDLPTVQLTSKKGLGGWHLPRSPKTESDIVDLGIKAVTININAMHDLVSNQRREGWPEFKWQGKTYFANPKRLKSIDQTLLAAQEHDLLVSVILLVTNPKKGSSETAKLLANPEASPTGIFAMPDVTSKHGLQFYGAIIKLMAERWTRPDGRYGRIHHWIIHNEVDFGWIWTNAGRKSDMQFMSLYHRSMRLVDLIVRQYDPNARVWISLTHHWASTGTPDGYGSKRMLELLMKYCKAEGDFPWAVAYHPYPQSLRNPRTWEDHQAIADFETDKITPKNLEVLDAWMKTPEMKYQGNVRPVHLSENGFNSPDYSAKSLDDQAAGMAYAWKKMQKLSSIKMWHYHNWIDNRGEGGLRIGLRKFPDDKQDPYAAKPIWHVYRALETDNEQERLQPYLKTIGISSWDQINSSQAID